MRSISSLGQLAHLGNHLPVLHQLKALVELPAAVPGLPRGASALFWRAAISPMGPSRSPHDRQQFLAVYWEMVKASISLMHAFFSSSLPS